MTEKLQDIFSRVSQLTSIEQDEIAARWLEELRADERWESSFRETQDNLARWADRVKKDIDQGKAVEKGWDEL